MHTSPPFDHPIAAILAVVIRDREVLLVRRANPPDAGLWGFPGGKIEKGERLQDAALRELREETGVSARALGMFNAVDALECDGLGNLQRHFILIAVLCKWTNGEPVAGDDAVEARWVDLEALGNSGFDLSRDVAEVARQGAALMAEAGS